MCDTMCATPNDTGGDMLFAKNSDRSPNEPHLVVRVPAADWPGRRMRRIGAKERGAGEAVSMRGCGRAYTNTGQEVPYAPWAS